MSGRVSFDGGDGLVVTTIAIVVNANGFDLRLNNFSLNNVNATALTTVILGTLFGERGIWSSGELVFLVVGLGGLVC